jgi:uncharacterized membrane protein YeaQ/YmgE (transglycosylase-associated protein family)
MELLFVILIAAGIGFIAQYALPGRETRGVLLLGAISAAVAAVVWASLLWLGFTFDGGWIWLISLVAGGLVAIIVAVTVPKRRRVADRAMLTKLSGGRA